MNRGLISNMAVLYGISENHDALEKGGKKAVVGETRYWNGGKDAWVRHEEGWVHVHKDGKSHRFEPNKNKGVYEKAQDHHVEFAVPHLEKHLREKASSEGLEENHHVDNYFSANERKKKGEGEVTEKKPKAEKPKISLPSLTEKQAKAIKESHLNLEDEDFESLHGKTKEAHKKSLYKKFDNEHLDKIFSGDEEKSEAGNEMEIEDEGGDSEEDEAYERFLTTQNYPKDKRFRAGGMKEHFKEFNSWKKQNSLKKSQDDGDSYFESQLYKNFKKA
jgi:hypothetical protein